MPNITTQLSDPIQSLILNISHLRPEESVVPTVPTVVVTHIPTDNDPTQLLSRAGIWDWTLKSGHSEILKMLDIIPKFEKRMGQPREFWSLVSTIDGSTLPQDCVEEQLC